MVLSLTYVTIETIDPEPAYASGEFACFNNDGRAYAYQSVWDSDHLDVTDGKRVLVRLMAMMEILQLLQHLHIQIFLLITETMDRV